MYSLHFSPVITFVWFGFPFAVKLRKDQPTFQYIWLLLEKHLLLNFSLYASSSKIGELDFRILNNA